MPRVISSNKRSSDIYEFDVEQPQLDSFTEFRKRQRTRKLASAGRNLFNFSGNLDSISKFSSRLNENKNVKNKIRTDEENFTRLSQYSPVSSPALDTNKNENNQHSSLISPIPDINENEIDVIDKELEKRTRIKEKQSDIERIRQIFTQIQPAINDLHDEIGNETCSHSDHERIDPKDVAKPDSNQTEMLKSKSITQNITEESPTRGVISVTTNSRSQREGVAYLHNNSISSSQECKLILSELFHEETASKSSSSSSLNSKPEKLNTSNTASRPALNMSIIQRPLKHQLCVESESIVESEFGNTNSALSNTEKISPEIEQLVRDISSFKMSAQKMSSSVDRPAYHSESEFHLPTIRELSGIHYDDSEKTQPQLADTDSDEDFALFSNSKLAETPDNCTPPKQILTSVASPEVNVQKSRHTDAPNENESSLSANEKQSTTVCIERSNITAAVPTPESQCCIISDLSQLSEHNKNVVPVYTEQFEEGKKLVPDHKNLRSSKLANADTSNILLRIHGSDSDEEALIFRTSKWPPLIKKKSGNCNVSKMKTKTSKTCDISKHPTEVSIKIKSNSKKNVKKLTDFVDYKIIKNRNRSTANVNRGSSLKLGMKKKRKLYTETDDEKLCGYNKRCRQQSKQNFTKKTAKSQSSLFDAKTEMYSYKNKEDKNLTPFTSVFEKMEFLSLSTAHTPTTSLAHPPQTPISPALFSDESRLTPLKVAPSNSTNRKVLSQKSSLSITQRKNEGNKKVENNNINFKRFSPETSLNKSVTKNDPSSPFFTKVYSKKQITKRSIPSELLLKTKTDDKMWNANSSFEGFSQPTTSNEIGTDQTVVNLSVSPSYSGKKTLKYINESIRECLNLPRTPDSLPSQFSAFTSEKESDTSPQLGVKKSKKVKTLKQRNVKMTSRLCMDSSSSSEDDNIGSSSSETQRSNFQLNMNKLCKLYVPKTNTEHEKKIFSSKQPQSGLFSSSDTETQNKTHSNSTSVPSQMGHNCETPSLTEQYLNTEKSLPTHQLKDSLTDSIPSSFLDKSNSHSDAKADSVRKRIGFLTEDDYESDDVILDLNFQKDKG